jgi:hypothetical protein
MTDELERDIEAEVMRVASERGHRLFKNVQAVAKFRSTKTRKVTAVLGGCGGKGAPDLWGWTRDGYAVLIEMKKPGERPKKHQNDWREAALVSCPGLRIGWADSVDGALEILEGVT